MKAAHKLTVPARRSALPVMGGNGRGLRVRVGPSSLMRIVSTVEADVEEVFLDSLRPGGVVYDVGANIGWFSLLAARGVGPGGAVYAFEPFLANAYYLRLNAASNGFGNVTTVPAAVGSTDGWARFAEESSLEGRLSSEGESLVPLLSLDKWVAEMECRPPDLLKIDVEGAEADVLRGMEALLSSAKPVLIIELHGTGPEVTQVLEGFGYEHSPIGDPTTSVHLVARPAGPAS